MTAGEETVTVETDVAAPPGEVFEFFVDPGKYARWHGVWAELDARPGGAYRVKVLDRDVPRLGTFVEVVPPRRVVFTWGWDHPDHDIPPASTTVTVELGPRADGTTTVRLRHEGLPGREWAQAHARGWDHYLGRLAAAAEGRDPGPDPWNGAADPASA